MESEKYLIFSVDEKIYSLSFSDVKIIIPSEKPEVIPDFPEYVLGTITHEKKILPVVDLRRRFHFPVKELSDRDCFIISDSPDKQIAMVVDSISGFVEISADKIQPPPELNEEASAKFLSGGFVDSQGRTVRVIDPQLIVKLSDQNVFNQN